mgnify:CR=1 FL=1
MPQNYTFPVNFLTILCKIFVFGIRLSHFKSILTETALLSLKIPHRTALSGYFLSRKFTVQKWGVRMSQNSASIANEVQESPKTQPQLHTPPFRKRI